MLAFNWEGLWQAWAAAAGTALALVTGLLVWVGYEAVKWAKLRFGQTEEIEARRRVPLVALSLVAPPSPETYIANAREGQFDAYLKWWRAISTSDMGPLIQQHSVIACWAYNIGEGPALRIRVPYRLEVFEITRVGSAASSDTVQGEFEIVHVPSNAWGGAKTFLDVTYYPKYRIELLLDGVRVVGLDGADVAGALAPTCEPVYEGDNNSFWEFLRRTQPQSPPPSNPFVDKLLDDRGSR